MVTYIMSSQHRERSDVNITYRLSPTAVLLSIVLKLPLGIGKQIYHGERSVFVCVL